MTIYFMVPDRKAPTGGVKVMYGIARALREHGTDARVWQSSSQQHPEAVSEDRITLKAHDTLCVAEIGPAETRAALLEVPVVVINQGHYHTLGLASVREDVSQPYPRWGQVRAAVATSESVEQHLHEIGVGVPIHFLRIYVDDVFFRPITPLVEREKIVSFMPRRRGAALQSMLNTLRRDGTLDGWSIQSIDGMTTSEVAHALHRSRLFLHGAQEEGLGLPGLEAMACGALVAGFAGDGGREFMLEDNSFQLPADNLTQATRKLRQIISSFDDALPDLTEMTLRARARVDQNYSWARFSERVGTLSQTLVRASVGREVTVHHTTHLARLAARPTARQRLGLVRRALRP